MNPGMQVVIIAGNHDSAARLEAPVPLLEELNTFITGIVSRNVEGIPDYDSLLIPLYNRQGERKALCMAVPFLRQGDYPPSEDTGNTYVAGINRMYRQLYEYADSMRQPGEAILAMGHLHATGAELSDNDRSERIIMGGLESVSADTFDAGLAYTALGHIHKAQRVGGRDTVRYAGSPLPMSFSETNYNHQVVAIAIENDKTVSVTSLSIPRKVELMCVPVKPVSPQEVLEVLSRLPVAGDELGCSHPFLEVRVLLTEPDPGFRHRVEEALADKAVRLTSIVPSYPKQDESDEIRPLSYNDLQNISPLDMLRHTFAGKYGGELPEEIEGLFNDVMREVSL